jgi:type I restriction enzyme S subunit
MNLTFTPVRLGEILKKSEDWVEIEPQEKYKQVTIKMWGQGVTLRQEVSGAEIAASRQLVVHQDQFILSRIDARNGAFGLVPLELGLSLTECVTDYELPRQANSLSRK